MSKAKGRQGTRNKNYYKKFRELLPAKKSKQKLKRHEQQQAVALGEDLGSKSLQSRRAYFIRKKVRKLQEPKEARRKSKPRDSFREIGKYTKPSLYR